MQGVIVGGATGVVRAGTSFARAIQTGYLRAYALVLLMGVGALVLYFLIDELVTIHLSIVIFLPLAAGLVAAFLPRRSARWVVLAGAVGVLGYAIVAARRIRPGATGLQYVTDDELDPGARHPLLARRRRAQPVPDRPHSGALGAVHDRGRASREWDRPRLFFFNMALAETAVLGAFMAQDLALFVFFFDLMLVPFYFLIGAWGGGERVHAPRRSS